MSRTRKVLEVLRLFDATRSHVRAADVAELLEVSSATAYRCIADLEAAGLLERVADGQYVLGPAIVELDREIRRHDPLIAAAADVMKGLAERNGGAVLLSRLHGLKVLCVHEVRGRLSPTVSYERGRAMPLYRGATSKVILAHLGEAALARLVERDAAGLRKAGLPSRLDKLREHLAPWREDKVCSTSGEVDPGATGWAAPLFHGKTLLGSLSVVMPAGTPALDGRRIADQVMRAALRIEARLEDAARPSLAE
jgi:DNA-binding IclR family transcriptional regulator